MFHAGRMRFGLSQNGTAACPGVNRRMGDEIRLWVEAFSRPLAVCGWLAIPAAARGWSADKPD